MTENEIAKLIVDAALKIHRSLGPGLLESVYEVTLAYELERRGLRIIKQQALPVFYEGVHLELGFRADLIVNKKVIIEIKSIRGSGSCSSKAVRDISAANGSQARSSH